MLGSSVLIGGARDELVPSTITGRRCGVVIDSLIYVHLPVPGDGSRPKLVNKDDGNVRAARRRVVVVIVVSRMVLGKMKWKRAVRYATAQESVRDIIAV